MAFYILRIYLILPLCLLTLSCNQGQIEIDGICSDCSSNCQSCLAPGSCSTCNPGYRLNILQLCVACSNGCQVCSSLSCTTCFPKFYKSSSNCYVCPTQCATCTSSTVCQTCLDNYFILGSSCSVCDVSCKTCENSSITCTSCDVGKYLSGSQCFLCYAPCFSCINNPNHCTSCIDHNQKVINFQCVCNDGYYKDEFNQCQLCIQPCSKCEFNANNCTDCVFTFTLSLQIPNKCECSIGYFSFDSETCKQCQAPCQSCEQDVNHCLTCIDQNQVVNELNTCVCKTGWVLNIDGITCIQCQLPCIDCVQTINICVTCQDQSHQQPDSCKCEPGWIYDSHYFCVPCLQPCDTCEISTSRCLSCLDDNHEINNQSQCVCKTTFYSNSLTTCSKCNEPCYECDLNGCINCIDTNQIINSNYQCVCKPGYVLQGVNCFQCQIPCSTCVNNVNDCLTCLDFNQIVSNYQWDVCCDQYCFDCQGMNNCVVCQKGFYLTTNSRCSQCIDHCNICFNQKNCDKCQDGYFIDQNYQCQICSPYCNICNHQSTCDTCFNGYYLNNQVCEICNTNCLTCILSADKCLTCKLNYQINIKNQCECKNGYYEQENECFECQYLCQKCLSSQICEQCVQLPNLLLDMDYQCKCANGYFWDEKFCLQCDQKCLTCQEDSINCLSCAQSRILSKNRCVCKDNYFENEYGFCISCDNDQGKTQEICRYRNCSDQIWTYGEECDDGNNVNRDGCSNCNIDLNYTCFNQLLKPSICLQCQANCLKCKFNPLSGKSQCILCATGYFLDKNNCVECSANCLECIDRPNNCLSCKFQQNQNGKCSKCESEQGYFFNVLDKYCQPICGDQIKVYNEQCDDGNIIDGDGCDSNCKIEYSNAYLNKQKNFEKLGKNQFKFWLNNNRIISNLDCLTANISIDYFGKDEFLFNSTQTDHSCNVQFQFFKSIFASNTIHISFQILQIKQRLLLENQTNMFINYDIIPEDFIVLSQSEIDQIEGIENAQSTFAFIFLILIPISIIANLFDYLWTILEILSWVNNFYFLNVKFPFNVEAFLKNSDWSNLITFPTYQELNQPGCDYYFKAPKKFDDKGINPLFINNAQVPFLFILSAVTLYLFNYLIKYCFQILDVYCSKTIKSRDKHLSIFKIEEINPSKKKEDFKKEEVVKHKQILHKIVNLLQKTQQGLKQKIKQTISLCLLDISLSILLQITSNSSSQNSIVIGNQYLAYLSINLIFFQLYQSYQIVNIHPHLAENMFYKERYGIYYDKINTSNSFGLYYFFLGLLKKLLYIYFMVTSYNSPTIQTLFCFAANSISLAILLYTNPFKTKFQYLIQLTFDICLSTIIFITIGFSMNVNKKVRFIEENKVILGWAIISLVVIAISVEIFMLMYELILQFYNLLMYIKSAIQKQQQEETKNEQTGEQSNVLQTKKKDNINVNKNKLQLSRIAKQSSLRFHQRE
ncbi:unnamed protein product [Paramecium sonneborni]|uniref:EGF-like domain-containing protein n=1 Tax=Paramecium sonneborni TaxID=65129 RepID=A0A8S1RTD2_9CILI|nr:unnamed protein product [Paramecium sonneborni]